MNPLPEPVGAVQHHHRVAHDALRVAPRMPDRDVVQAQLGQRLAALELEVVNDVVGAGRRALGLDGGRAKDGAECAVKEGTQHGEGAIARGGR